MKVEGTVTHCKLCHKYKLWVWFMSENGQSWLVYQPNKYTQDYFTTHTTSFWPLLSMQGPMLKSPSQLGAQCPHSPCSHILLHMHCSPTHPFLSWTIAIDWWKCRPLVAVIWPNYEETWRSQRIRLGWCIHQPPSLSNIKNDKLHGHKFMVLFGIG